MKLDLKDRKILYELDCNASQPLTKIAKKVKLSRESILYRIKKYFEEGLIRNYLTIIDMSKLGFTHYKIYLKTHNLTETKEEEFLTKIKKDPFVSWIGSCDGEYSHIIGIKTKNLKQLQEKLREINSKFSSVIKEYEITTIIEAKHFHRDYLTQSKSGTEREIKWGQNQEEAKIDEKDLKILDALSKNSRVTAVEISKEAKLSADSIIKRIENMEKKGIITNYTIWPNVNKLIGLYYKVLINTKNFNKENEKKFQDYCQNNANIVYVVNSLGKWQIELDIEIESLEEFRKIIKELTNNFSEIIINYTTLNIYNEHKFRFFDKEVLNLK